LPLFGPRSPSTVAGGTAVTLPSATTPPNRFWTLSTTMAGASAVIIAQIP
jgi:hypothetical protein